MNEAQAELRKTGKPLPTKNDRKRVRCRAVQGVRKTYAKSVNECEFIKNMPDETYNQLAGNAASAVTNSAREKI